MKKTHRLIPGLSLQYGHFCLNGILPSGVFDGGVSRCKLQYSMVLISDAPSESEALCHSPREDIFTFVPSNHAKNVSTRSHLLIVGEVSPVPISLYVTINGFKEFKWVQTREYRFNSENWASMHKQMRS
jgi:hypothetical protein